MKMPRLVAVACLLLATAGLGAETWEGALAKLKTTVDAKQGYGLVVQIERVDARRLGLRLQTLGTTFKTATFQARMDGQGTQQVFVLEGRDLDAMSGATLIDGPAGDMDLILTGPDFNPRIRIRIPAEGQAPEVGVVTVGSRSTPR